MALNKFKIYQLVSLIDERNKYGISEFCGININKQFMDTFANTENLDETKYKVVRQNRFVYSGMQTGRDKCIRISMYMKKEPIIVSPAYTTFEITATDLIIPEFFYMLFLSTEKDRLGWFYSDSSIRSNLDWERFCDIELELPPIEVQQKYVDVYNSMVTNQEAYESGLDDLKLTCETYIDNIKKCARKIVLSKFLSEVDNRNNDLEITEVKGVNIFKEFMPSVANVASTDLRKYKVISKGIFVYSAMQTGRDKVIRIALYKDDEKALVSPAYTMLKIVDKNVLPEYVMIWFSRSESDRFGWFLSDASIRASLETNRFLEIQIPIPDIAIQEAIVGIYNAYIIRKDINEKMKKQIKDICPILIKGSLN